MTADRTVRKTADDPTFGDWLGERIGKIEAQAGRSITYRELEDRSGGLVSHSTWHRLRTGRAPSRLEPQVVEGVAKALRCSQRSVRAFFPADPYGSAYVPPKEAALLTALQREVVDAVIRQMARKPNE